VLHSFILVHASVLFDACRDPIPRLYICYTQFIHLAFYQTFLLHPILTKPPSQNPFLGIVSSWLCVLIMLPMMLTYSCDFALADPPIPLSGD